MNLNQKQLLDLENDVSVLVKKFGNTLLEEWQSKKEIFFRERKEPFTEFDLRIEQALRVELTKLLPNAGFILEEEEDEKQEEYNWVIDPIDQTRNFIGEIPIFYVQVALIYKDGPILGVIFNPVSNQLFSASYENGAKLNGKLLINETEKELKDSIVDIDFGGGSDFVWKNLIFNKLTEFSHRVRLTGAAFAPYLLTGGIDAFVFLHQETKIVDQMPRIILFKEFGLLAEAIDFENHKIFIAGNKTIVKEIKNLILDTKNL